MDKLLVDPETHERRNRATAAYSRNLLQATIEKSKLSVASHLTEARKMEARPTNFAINMGTPTTAQPRWQAWDKAAKSEGCRSLSEWAKKHLDDIAGYAPKSK